MATSTPPFTALGGSTSTRDYLYRALYLRRELLILATQRSSNDADPSKSATGAEPPSASDSSTLNLNDILLLPPLYGVEGLTAPPVDGGSTPSDDPMLTIDHAWRGLVHIRGPSSPWYRGCFAFHAYFPSRYPFEPPIVEFTTPLRSHPLVQERRALPQDHVTAADLPSEFPSRVAPQSSAVTNTSTAHSSSIAGRCAAIPFEDVYAAVDPMRVSVMAVLLQHVLRFFYPAEWTAAMEAAATSAAAARGTGQSAAVNRVVARRDVERRSVTQEVALGRPFEQYVGDDVAQHFLQLWDTAGAAGAVDATGTMESNDADWYTREVLPHLLHS
ncbi:hypothetical protein ABB37_05785 [Leptomonas pyrrhocoris]|uniref:UBC core domain-containing protein n=1 Tax=Leptomonas pyrrhocoris TaxID=157538 RepID=A0A0M9FZL4_LEPPY|nr:hypothetical protein ABB37_05785 [Leptomonas pyrrhocoris]KPA79335.1 hypothetical protein ABB37_05785 [Leptomonas pyrrhocoris]|eukprot:XP_015657774.1 hypothetical protein ABB37_05785 [Leptomonas pyrrhocoris]